MERCGIPVQFRLNGSAHSIHFHLKSNIRNHKHEEFHYSHRALEHLLFSL